MTSLIGVLFPVVSIATYLPWLKPPGLGIEARAKVRSMFAAVCGIVFFVFCFCFGLGVRFSVARVRGDEWMP